MEKVFVWGGQLMGEDKNPLQGQSLEELESQVKGEPDEAFNIENEEERITHYDETLDPFATVANISFERILFGAGIGLLVVLFVIAFTFYTTLQVDNQGNTLVISEAGSIYEDLLEDENYIFTYKVGAVIGGYDPLNSEFEEDAKSTALKSVNTRTNGNFNVVDNAQRVTDGQGNTVMVMEDPALQINKLISLPDGNSFVFDVKPATQQAKDKFGLRLGAYEYDLEDKQVITLVSDASPGSGTPGYLDNYVYILSLSPHGRYLAYANSSKLWLYDRLSGASIDIAEASKQHNIS